MGRYLKRDEFQKMCGTPFCYDFGWGLVTTEPYITYLLLLYLPWDYSLLQNKPTFWHFPLWNGQFHEGKILSRSCAKSTIFSSIAYDNVKTFSMNFGFKILSGYGITSHQTLSFHFSILKWSFFHTFNFEALELHHPL